MGQGTGFIDLLITFYRGTLVARSDAAIRSLGTLAVAEAESVTLGGRGPMRSGGVGWAMATDAVIAVSAAASNLRATESEC